MLIDGVAPCVAQYGQCDGLQYTGTKECCVPSICEYSNPWFSQCIPSSAPPIAGINWTTSGIEHLHFWKMKNYRDLQRIYYI
jgi:hypothetical protein